MYSSIVLFTAIRRPPHAIHSTVDYLILVLQYLVMYQCITFVPLNLTYHVTLFTLQYSVQCHHCGGSTDNEAGFPYPWHNVLFVVFGEKRDPCGNLGSVCNILCIVQVVL